MIVDNSRPLCQRIERSSLPRYNGKRVVQLTTCLYRYIRLIDKCHNKDTLVYCQKRLAKVIRVYRRCF